MKPLADNRALYVYLGELAELLKEHRLEALAEAVAHARCYASGSSSEFLHEAALALQRVLAESSGRLTDQEIADVEEVAAQIERAFKAVGGA